MDEANEEFNPTQMLAAAIGMAGLLGGAAFAAQRRRRRPDERATLGFDTPVASLKLSVAKPDTDKLQRQARARTKEARDALERVHLPSLATLPAALTAPDIQVDELRAQAGEATDRVLAVATRLSDEVVDRANLVGRRLTDDLVATTAHLITDEVLPRLRDDLLPQVTETLRDELVPTVTTAAGAAAATMAEAAQTSRKQLAEAAQRAREEGSALGADVATIAGARAKKASKRGMFGRKTKKSRADDLLATLGTAGALGVAASQASKATEQAQQAVGQARKQSKKAATATTSFVGDTVGAIFWLLTAAVILLYAFASPEQRERVMSNLRTFWEQAAELYQDFQGYSEEIDSPAGGIPPR